MVSLMHAQDKSDLAAGQTGEVNETSVSRWPKWVAWGSYNKCFYTHNGQFENNGRLSDQYQQQHIKRWHM